MTTKATLLLAFEEGMHSVDIDKCVSLLGNALHEIERSDEMRATDGYRISVVDNGEDYEVRVEAGIDG